MGRRPTAYFLWKVVAASLVALAAQAIFLHLAATPAVRQHERTTVELRLVDEAAWAARAVDWATGRSDGGGEGRLAAIVAEISRTLSGHRVTLIAEDGRVVADSHHPDVSAMDDHGSRPEVLRPGTIQERFSRSVRREMIYVSHPLARDDGSLLHVRVASPSSELAAGMDAAGSSLAWYLAMGLLLGVVVALAVSVFLTRPLRQMTSALTAMAHGEALETLPVTGHDELAQLGGAVNELMSQLARRVEGLNQSNEQTRAVFASMEEGVVVLGQRGSVRLVNAAARRLLATGTGELIGRPLLEITPFREVAMAAHESLATGERIVREVRLEAREGEVALHVSAVPLTKDVSLWGCVVVLYDLTEIRRVEAMRRDFVANVSHELKTPLTAMKGYLEAVSEDEEMPEPQRRRFLQKAARNTDRLSRIVQDLLALARFQSDSTADFEQLDLGRLVEDCVQELRGDAEMRGVVLRIERDAGATAMTGDADALATAVNNLIDNAIKYSSEGSEVLVSVGTRDGCHVVDVVDRGVGIPLQEQDRVFERFYRVDKNRSRDLGGTGLGLSIVKHAVGIHGGEVTVTSCFGQGSTFSIRLPAGLEDAHGSVD